MSVNSFLLAQSSVNSLSVGPAVLRAVLPDFRVIRVIGALAAQTANNLWLSGSIRSAGRRCFGWTLRLQLSANQWGGAGKADSAVTGLVVRLPLVCVGHILVFPQANAPLAWPPGRFFKLLVRYRVGVPCFLRVFRRPGRVFPGAWTHPALCPSTHGKWRLVGGASVISDASCSFCRRPRGRACLAACPWGPLNAGASHCA